MMKLITGALLLFCLASHCSDAAPKPGVYILPEKHGFVPVYIRHGNTPLSEINSYLATAFHENVDVKPIDFPVEFWCRDSRKNLIICKSSQFIRLPNFAKLYVGCRFEDWSKPYQYTCMHEYCQRKFESGWPNTRCELENPFTINITRIFTRVLLVIDAAPAPALQILPERDGFIPVYVRYGNTPLKEINLNLAAAFHEDDLPPFNAPEELNEQNEETDMLDISDLKDESPKQKRSTSDKEEDKKLEQKQTSAQTSEECSDEEQGKKEEKRRRRSVNTNESSESSEEDKQKKDETKKPQSANSSEESSSESDEEKKDKQTKPHASDEKKETMKTIRRRSADNSEGGDNSADSHSNEDESNPSTLHVIKQLPAAPARK